jgi:hypothetical protein
MTHIINLKNNCIKNLLFFCLCSSCILTQSNQDIFDLIKQQQKKPLKKYFKSNENYDLVDNYGTSSLIHSVKSRNIHTLKFLLKQKNILINHKDQHNKTALDYAIELEGVNENSALILQHMQYDMCTSLVNKGGKVTSSERDIKLRSFLLKGKPKYDKTLLGFCVDNSPIFISSAAAYKMTFLGPFVSAVTNFLGSFASYSIERISHYRRFKKYNHSFLL